MDMPNQRSDPSSQRPLPEIVAELEDDPSGQLLRMLYESGKRLCLECGGTGMHWSEGRRRTSVGTDGGVGASWYECPYCNSGKIASAEWEKQFRRRVASYFEDLNKKRLAEKKAARRKRRLEWVRKFLPFLR